MIDRSHTYNDNLTIVTFLVILAFQPELGESTAIPALADQKTPRSSSRTRGCGPRCTGLKYAKCGTLRGYMIPLYRDEI